jgi:hypothetical protein
MVAENYRHLHRNVTGFLLIFDRICSKVSNLFLQSGKTPSEEGSYKYFKKGAYYSKK